MKKLLTTSYLVAALLMPLAVHAEGENKVVICHKEPQKQDITISVDESAVDAHLAHGDSRGACPGTVIPEFNWMTGAVALFASGAAFYMLRKNAYKYAR